MTTPRSPRRTSDFKADREKQVTGQQQVQQTAGVNPDPPAQESSSVPADAPPMVADTILAPYYGMDC